MREFDKYGYRVLIIEDNNFFVRDQLGLVILERTPDGYKPVTIEIKYAPAIPASDIEGAVTSPLEATTVIPRELAQMLLAMLVNYYMGSEEHNLVSELRRVSAELRAERVRLNKLIDGIGRLGGNNDRTEI